MAKVNGNFLLSASTFQGINSHAPSAAAPSWRASGMAPQALTDLA